MSKIEEFMNERGKTLKPNTLKDEAKKITKSNAVSKPVNE